MSRPPESPQPPEIVAVSHGIQVPAAPHFGPSMIASLRKGRFEAREVEAAAAVIKPGARILELGAGSGFVGAAVARACAPEAMLAVEANPALIEHIRQLYELNGLSNRIDLIHGVVLSDPAAPSEATFHVRGNFLGSGLNQGNANRKTTSVRVPTHRYQSVTAQFPHDTIIMDIEGAELDFFAHADLSSVRTVIFEAHRHIYGREGMRACRRELAKAGFTMDRDVSGGGVHVWQREPSGTTRIDTASKTGGKDRLFRDRIEQLRDAVVIPERPTGTKLASGVLDRRGRFVELSRSWIRDLKSTVAPELRPGESVAELSGLHVYAGHLRGHFGHFLVESTARLWALGDNNICPDGVVFLPFAGKTDAAKRALARYQPLLECLEITVPARIVDVPTRVETLCVPELGFGWRDGFAGSSAYRAFMKSRLRAAGTPEGPEALYVSRSALRADKGGLLGERILEENLRRMGYEVFHPERHDIRTQIARYRAARRIVALDGSALHLAAFVVEPGTRVALILRRSRANHGDYTRQYQAFQAITPDIIDAIRTDWTRKSSHRSNFRSLGEASFEEIFLSLSQLGYIPTDARPDLPDKASWEALRQEAADARDADLVAVGRAVSVGAEDGL
ncbi:MAG: FkbM family methyltransferase [Pseudomonadota bacterium]